MVLDNMPASLDVATISVCLSRVTRIEDLQIFPLDVKNKEKTKHLLRLHNDYVTHLWEHGYEKWNNHWDPERFDFVHKARLKKLMKEFAHVRLGKLKVKGENGLDAWLRRFNIARAR